MRRTSLVFLAVAVLAPAQWLDLPFPVPMGADGKPNLHALTPRAADGHPDLSGLWVVDDRKYFFDIASDAKEPTPYTALGQSIQRQREADIHKDDPVGFCLPPGLPRMYSHFASPFKILQRPDLIAVLSEASVQSTFVQIFLDGRRLSPDAPPTYYGYSLGRWDGDTLVVETTGFNGKIWLDTTIGRPASEALRVTQKFHRTDFGNMTLELTFTDPVMYTRPWSVVLPIRLALGTELIETVCENERDSRHLVGK
ncbi:MAG: hypothetical protein RL328_2125 [Acidobacteriota bacterium]